MKRLRPLQAVRRKCMWCCCNSANEVSLCPADECELWPFRFGKNPIGGPRFKLKIIRQKCLDCHAGDKKEIRLCDTGSKESEWDVLRDRCALHPYRFGKNPNIKGRKANKGSFSRKTRLHDPISDTKPNSNGLIPITK
jgi:hypothetical protein